MSGQFTYSKRHKYPHMVGNDTTVWDRFISKFPGRFDSVDYDWRVGDGMDLNTSWDENIKRMATMITQKRIDVVGWNDNLPTLIEVRQRIGLGILGQILGYKTLFERDFPNIIKPRLLVVCEEISKDDLAVMGTYDIPVEVV